LIDGFRKRICTDCDEKTLMWPPHLTLFYGITVEDREPLLLLLRKLARETRSFPMEIDGLGSFGESVLYLKIKFSKEIALLQARVREIVGKTCDIQCDYGNYTKPDGTRLSPEEIESMKEWGSYYPFAPHMTLAQHLSPGQLGRVEALGARALPELPERLMAGYMSLAVFESDSPVSETIEAMSFAEAEP
jgi:2'-5' RNA ligase